MRSITRLILVATMILVARVARGDDSFSDGTIVSTAANDGSVFVGSLVLDGNVLWVVGSDTATGNQQWRVERRRLPSGVLDVGFGQDGVTTSNPSVTGDDASTVVRAGDAIVIGGGDGIGSYPGTWRLEQRDRLSGALVSPFGENGILRPEGHRGAANGLLIDQGDLIVLGSADGWRVERRRLHDGALVTGFSVEDGPGTAFAALVAGDTLFVAGTADYGGWRLERRQRTTGALIGAASETFPDVGCGGQGAFAIAADTEAVYVGGAAAGRWRLEKRRITDGALVWGRELPGSGSCDAIQSVAVSAGAVLVGGRQASGWRLERRSKSTGDLDAAFGVDGAVVPSGFSFGDMPSIVIADDIVYAAINEFTGGAGSQMRLERRYISDGSLAGIDDTEPPQEDCPQIMLEDCRIAVTVRKRRPTRGRFDVRCSVPLPLPPSIQTLDRLSLTLGSGCVDDRRSVTVVRRSRCWRWQAGDRHAAGLHRLTLCEDRTGRRMRLRARGRNADVSCLQLPNASVTLVTGDANSAECDPATTTTTTTSSTTTTRPLEGCFAGSDTRTPALVVNADPRNEDWLSPNDARTEDDRTALVRISGSDPSSTLRARDFGFDVPDTARIDGITVDVRRGSREFEIISDRSVRLATTTGLVGAEHAYATPWDQAYTTVVYGGPSDDWGIDWSPAMINDPTFGIGLSVGYRVVSGNDDASVDVLRITVHYSCPGDGPS